MSEARRRARDPSSDDATLRALAIEGDPSVCAALAANPSLPIDLLAALCERHPREVAHNPALHVIALERPGFFRDLPARSAVSMLQLPEAPAAVVGALLSHRELYVRVVAASHERCPPWAVHHAAQHPDLALGLAHNPTAPPSLLSSLVSSANPRHLAIAAAHPSTPREQLTALRKISSEGGRARNAELGFVLAALALNPSTPPSCQAALAELDDEGVRVAIVARAVAEGQIAPFAVPPDLARVLSAPGEVASALRHFIAPSAPHDIAPAGPAQTRKLATSCESLPNTRTGHNLDAALVARQPDGVLAAVIDGVTDVKATQIAEAVLVGSYAARVAAPSTSPPLSRLIAALRNVDQALAMLCSLWVGVSASALAVAVEGDRLAYAQQGLCRLYRRRRGALERLTREHSLVELAREAQGDALAAELSERGFGGVVIQVLGQRRPPFVPDVGTVTIEPGDVYVLTTSGLYRRTSDAQIDAALAHPSPGRSDAEELASLVDAAERHDDLSVAVVRVPGP